MTPRQVALFLAYPLGGAPREAIASRRAEIETRRSTWRYRLFAPRWRREADRHAAEMLGAMAEEFQRRESGPDEDEDCREANAS